MNNRNLFNHWLSIINILAAFLYFIVQTQLLFILVVLQIFIIIYFIKNNISYFVHSLFWPIFLTSLLIFPWPIAFIIPIIVYLIIILPISKFKNEIQWLKIGSFNKRTIVIMIPTILISSIALITWVFLLKPDLADLKNMIPTNSIVEIIIIGLLFSIFNSIWEELILKGILWNGIEIFISNVIIIILFQAILFGIMHLNGFPRGIIGAMLAGIYGVLIGFIRKYSKGLLAPIVTHFFADATIFGILVWIHL